MVLPDLQRVRLGRRPPVHVPQLVAGDVLAQRVEGQVAHRDLVAGRALLVADHAEPEGLRPTIRGSTSSSAAGDQRSSQRSRRERVGAPRGHRTDRDHPATQVGELDPLLDDLPTQGPEPDQVLGPVPGQRDQRAGHRDPGRAAGGHPDLASSPAIVRGGETPGARSRPASGSTARTTAAAASSTADHPQQLEDRPPTEGVEDVADDAEQQQRPAGGRDRVEQTRAPAACTSASRAERRGRVTRSSSSPTTLSTSTPRNCASPSRISRWLSTGCASSATSSGTTCVAPGAAAQVLITRISARPPRGEMPQPHVLHLAGRPRRAGGRRSRPPGRRTPRRRCGSSP